MKRIVFALALLFLVGSLIAGFATNHTLLNTSFHSQLLPDFSKHLAKSAGGEAPDGADCLVAPQQGINVPRDYRPDGGIIDGQGCCSDDACLAVCEKCECWNKNANNVGDYLWFVDYSAGGCQPWLGGNVYFEYRGYNGIVYLPLMLTLLSIFLICALVVAFTPHRFTSWAHKRLFHSYNGRSKPVSILLAWKELTIGEYIAMFWIMAMMLLGFLYLYEHARINNLVGKVSRGFGGVCVMCAALVIFPATRHSVLLPSFGVSFEKTLKYHRTIGGIFYLCATAHMILMFVAYTDVYHRGDPFQEGYPGVTNGTRSYVNQVSIGEALKKSADRTFGTWNVGFPHGPPVAGFIAWLVMTLMMAGTAIRRSKWETFLILHLGYAVVFIFAMMHYPTLLFLCIPSFAAYAIDLSLRYRRFGVSTIVEATETPAGITRLKIRPAKAITMEGGEFVTIGLSVLDRSFSFEHHPFSVSSHCDDGCFTLHIKDFGEGTWTHSLAEAASTLATEMVRVDGPFGRLPVPLGGKHVSYLVGGGVGVTPLMHMVQIALEQKLTGKIKFIWSVRKADMLEAFTEELLELFDKCSRTDGAVTMSIYETSKKQPTQNTTADEVLQRVEEGTADEDHPLAEPLLAHDHQVPVQMENPISRSTEPARKGEHVLPTMGGSSSASARATGSGAGRASPTHTPRADANPSASAGRSSPPQTPRALKLLELPETLPGRPPLKKLLVVPDGCCASDVAVYTCGPAPMVASVQELCLDEGFLCHEETFEF